MPLTVQVAIGFSVGVFLYYGLDCLLSDGMVAEFERYDLSRYRRLTGALEVLGAIGLAVGLIIPVILAAASAGLALLMALGVATRVRVRDPLVEMVPALVLMLISAYILFHALAVLRGA